MVLVFGDTNTTLAGALAAVKLGIPAAHVEAGLRSFRMDMPEEINRVLTDRMSSLLFCPTKTAMTNLKNEGIRRGVVKSGDLMYELIDLYMDKIKNRTAMLDRYRVARGEYLFMTAHRAGNVDNKPNLVKLVDILKSLKRPVVFPVHPRTVKNLKRFKLWNGLKKIPELNLIEPVSYLANLTLIYNAYAVMTDSGGMQKEAVYLKTPCLTLRDETEWTETLEWGNSLVGLSKRKIMAALKKPYTSKRKMSCKIGSRKPSEVITASILSYFGK
jgi:UDP-N-acetylglucosamine 2-epimerase